MISKLKARANKRGLSDIVATVLIVLLALAAVAIVWSFIRPGLEKTGTSADLRSKCLLAEARPTQCIGAAVGAPATVTVQLVKGSATHVVAVVEYDDRTTKRETKDAPGVLGTVPITVPGVSDKTPKTARAAAVVADDKGNNATCDVSLDVKSCV